MISITNINKVVGFWFLSLSTGILAFGLGVFLSKGITSLAIVSIIVLIADLVVSYLYGRHIYKNMFFTP